MSDDPKLKVVHPDTEPAEPIPKPGKFSLDKFKSTQAASAAGVETLLTALPHYSIAEAKDFVRLHPDEDEYWSVELCFVNVPIKGQKHDTLHLIDEGLAKQYLPSARIQRFRLALATKPNDVFFLCHVPVAVSTTVGTRPTCKHASKQRRCGRRPLRDVTRTSTATRSTSARSRRLPRTEVADAAARRT